MVSSVTSGSGTVAAGGSATIDLINKYEQDKGSILVTKAAIGEPEKDKQYRIAVKQGTTYFKQDGTAATSDADKYVTLKNTESAEWKNLPAGSYTVEEEDASVEGFSWTVTGVGDIKVDRKSTRLNSSHPTTSRMPSSA